MLAVVEECQGDDMSAFAADICVQTCNRVSPAHLALHTWMRKCGHVSTRSVQLASYSKGGSTCCNVMAHQSAAMRMMHTLHFSFCWTEQWRRWLPIWQLLKWFLVLVSKLQNHWQLKRKMPSDIWLSYVVTKLSHKFHKLSHERERFFHEGLAQMGAKQQPVQVDSFLDYTTLWSELIDRGGLYHMC